MSKRVGAIFGAAMMLPALAVGLAGPAAAQDEWDMPDFRGMTLQGAVDEVAAVTDGAPLTLNVFNTTGAPQQITNATYWIVCYQNPSVGSSITLDSKVSLGLRRPNTSCW
ncbi:MULTISPECIES: hypothetical protein [Mycobacteriaceae]|uniref:hypothetical protein n=1 Tax=Mycobacteriaceae TaxID=1762 RepID=UPI0008015034|nr:MULTISPECIES: hypothetical protein [Mycobacteriaceae]MCK0174564.1 hypothetical protein [Mycolicibacterium sp. F2034L]OBB59052.1 hypothetical protein A5757_01090 [Mycobacterium sp. 852013-51886_SCH5428379]